MPKNKVVFSSKEFGMLRHDIEKTFSTLKDDPKSHATMVVSELEMIVRQLARKAANDSKYDRVIFD